MTVRLSLGLGLVWMLAFAGCAAEAQREAVTGCPTSPQGVKPLLVGSQLPREVVFTPAGERVLVRDVVARKPTVLVVYRGNWCVYCQQQLQDLQKIEPQLIGLGYQIVGVSPDAPEKLSTDLRDRRLGYQLLSDRQMGLIRALGLAYTVDDPTRRNLQRFGVQPVDLEGQSQYMLPVPAVFIVGTDGRIRFEYVNPDYKQRLDPELLLAAAKCLASNR